MGDRSIGAEVPEEKLKAKRVDAVERLVTSPFGGTARGNLDGF